MTVDPKNYFENSKNSVNKGTCFVLMPFANQFNLIYEMIKATLQSTEINLVCNRAEDFQKPYTLESILENLLRSEFIIADLTGANANVFYELGLAHAVKKNGSIIIIAQELSSIPFDLHQNRCIIYDNTLKGLQQLKDKINLAFHKRRTSINLNKTQQEN